MGRTEKSQGLAPPAVRKDIRAKQARHIINQIIPGLLASNSRARKGSESSELIADPASDKGATAKTAQGSTTDASYIKRKGQGRRKVKAERGAESELENCSGSGSKGRAGRRRADSVDHDIATLSITPATLPPKDCKIKVRIVITDTLTAACMLSHPSKYGTTPHQKTSKKDPNICILNMASPLRPGGGVLAGATSQEEYICARTTLLSSLKESFYRLPELGGVWSPDVLVFRNSLPLGDTKGELGPGERYWVDVVSAGMLRFPELEGGEEEVKSLSKSDRAVVEGKMRAVLRIVGKRGVKRLVLGAWGCGAYGNPVGDVADAWRKVLGGTPSQSGKKGKSAQVSDAETWPILEEVIFAISNRRMATDFAHAFDANLSVEAGPADSTESDEEDDEKDKVVEELRTKIQEVEGQMSKVWNADLKARMGVILEGLRTQLRERQGREEDDGSLADSDGSGSVLDTSHTESFTGGVRESDEDESESDEDEDENEYQIVNKP